MLLMTTNNIFFVSLGCDKNRIDSEDMLGYLSDAGFSFSADESEADIIIVNTCAFIDPAKEESIETILEMAQYKKIGKCRYLIVAGCLAERYKDEIMAEMPEIDAIIGVNDIEKIADVVKELDIENFKNLNPSKVDNDHKRVITTEGYYEYLKIADGCNKNCTYCIIPKIRGNYRSFPMEKLIREAEYLASVGVRELIIVAQETSIYGTDLYGKEMLPELLRELVKIDGIEWIRLLYAYPEDISDDLLDVMAKEEKICKYLDMPIQHASDNILKRMGRRTNEADLRRIISHIRDKVPGIVLRTTLITGFPGETEDDHKKLLSFVEDMRFEKLGVFTYSMEEGTAAARFDDQIDEDIKLKRQAELMGLQQKISAERLKNNIGKEFDVIIHGRLADEDVYVGRTYMDVPDVDGLVFMESDIELNSGDFVKAVITGTNEYDMTGLIIE